MSDTMDPQRAAGHRVELAGYRAARSKPRFAGN
jgi:hypothetical protein